MWLGTVAASCNGDSDWETGAGGRLAFHHKHVCAFIPTVCVMYKSTRSFKI